MACGQSCEGLQELQQSKSTQQSRGPRKEGKIPPECLETRDELYAASYCVLGVGLGFSRRLDMGEGAHLVRTPHASDFLLGAPLEAGCCLVIRSEPWVQNSSFLPLFLALVQPVSVGSYKKPGADT